MAVAATDVPPLPTELQVEVTGACNLRCRMCLVRYRPPLNRIQGAMSLETFRRLIDDLPDLEVLTLQGLGEPLLAPGLLEMVEYATSRGIRTGFNTNGTLLTRERAERLVRAGLDWLHVSIDGATAETYEDVRDGGRFERVRDNVAGLVDVMREADVDRPRIEIVFVAMRRNVRELPDLVRLAAAWGVGRVWVQNLSHSFSDTDPSGEYADIRTYAAEESLWGWDGDAGDVFGHARRVASDLGVHLRLPQLEETPSRRRPGQRGCDWPWRSSYVAHDGKVQPCCMVMGSDRATLGDLNASSFEEIWADEPYRRLRAALRTDDPPEICRGCSLYRRVF